MHYWDALINSSEKSFRTQEQFIKMKYKIFHKLCICESRQGRRSSEADAAAETFGGFSGGKYLFVGKAFCSV